MAALPESADTLDAGELEIGRRLGIRRLPQHRRGLYPMRGQGPS